MPLVKAQCTNCGGTLDVDNTKDAAICLFCNTPYIVEKAIQQFNINNTNYIKNAVIYDTTNSESGLLKRGITQLELKEWDDAAETFQNMTKLYPGNYKSWLGMCIVAANDYKAKYDEDKYRKNTMAQCPDDMKEKMLGAKVYSDGRIKNIKNSIKSVENNTKFNDEQIAILRRNIQILNQYRDSMRIGRIAAALCLIVGVILIFAVEEVGLFLAILCGILSVFIISGTAKPPKNVPANITSISEIDKELANQNSKLTNYKDENEKNTDKINRLNKMIEEEKKDKKTQYYIDILKLKIMLKG